MIDLVFLGTGSMFPTKERAHSSIFLRRGPENILFDCGEGTQRQMRIAGLSIMKLKKIFISHWHGDHSLGVAGIIQSLAASKRKEKLEIYGPPGTSARVKHLMQAFSFDMTYKVETVDLLLKDKEVKIIDTDEFAINAFNLKHVIPCLGFSFVVKGKRKIDMDYIKKIGMKAPNKSLGELQKGKSITFNGKKVTPAKATFVTPDKKIAYISDTGYFAGLIKFAKDSDLLISESTFTSDFKDKANHYTHLTAKQAAEIAKKAKAKRLILTHFSQRLVSLKPVKEEAYKVFKNVTLAKDFDKFQV